MEIVNIEQSLLHQLATGIQDLYSASLRSHNRRPSQNFYPPSLQVALNHFEYLRLNLPDQHPWKANPLHIPRLLEWATRPFSDWPFLFVEANLVSPHDVFLQNGFPTRVCEDWALSNTDVEAEMFQHQVISEIRASAIQDNRVGRYREARRFFSEHPVAFEEDLDLLNANREVASVQPIIQQAYYSAPLSFAVDNHWYLCWNCGNLLIPLRGQELQCENERCWDQGVNLRGESISISRQLFWLHRALRRFTFYPGQAELRLEERLSQISNVEVELWPSFDRYDLRLTFTRHDNEMWAVDVKDWANPNLLGDRVTRIANDGWSRAFFVFPRERTRKTGPYPDYVRQFNTRASARGVLGNDTLGYSEGDFIAEVEQYA